ncbi:MAG: hydantoinase B/oxoprolinase family protein [Actinobacteria bacterium]|nr:hydantoinase B/oxoprolinase family protein [Actinomycetota bacterium]
MATAALDVVTGSILRAKLASVIDEMATTLMNTAHSSRISTARAFACGMLDEDGQVVALDNPLHLASVARTSASVLDYYRFQVAADDVFVTNDPYGGGSTVQYFTLLAPLGHGDDIVAYLAVQAHLSDIGGVVMGNYHPTAIELWAEGARFTPLKIVVDGKPRRDGFDTVVLNSRDPEGFRGDLDAMLATIAVGRRRLAELIDEHGLASVQAGMAAAVDYAERRLRGSLDRIPEGRFAGEAVLDHDGQGRSDLAVRVELERSGDGLRLDFAATDDQSAGFVNSPTANTIAYALLPLLGLLDESVPLNAGLLRPLEIVLRPGSLVDPAYPAPTGWCREHVGFEITEAVSQALARALPEQAGLGFASRALVFTVTKDVLIGGVEEQLGVTDIGALAQTGAPATAFADGWGQPGPSSFGLLPSIEELEAEVAASVVRLEYVTDSGGPGAHRGGLGTETVVRFAAGSRERLYACVAGVEHAQPGNQGGHAGGPVSLAVLRDGEEVEIGTLMQDDPLRAGAEVRLRSAGGGGHGDPRERPVEAVVDDVRHGYVSVEQARGVYGVAVDAATLALDPTGTAALRGGGGG